jgi:hypothetical protein
LAPWFMPRLDTYPSRWLRRHLYIKHLCPTSGEPNLWVIESAGRTLTLPSMTTADDLRLLMPAYWRSIQTAAS